MMIAYAQWFMDAVAEDPHKDDIQQNMAAIETFFDDGFDLDDLSIDEAYEMLENARALRQSAIEHNIVITHQQALLDIWNS